LKIATKGGKVYYKEVAHALGSPEFPLTLEDCAEKFKDCASNATKEFSKESIGRVINLIEQLESVDDVREIIKLLV
jgi:2-methylcitrate dehydratase PrpD